MNNNIVLYGRVSTEKQGSQGLSIQSQRANGRRYAENNSLLIIGEYWEAISGTKDSREEFDKAVTLCKYSGATLVFKNMDRLSRNGTGLMDYLDSIGVNYIQYDSPNDNYLVKGIKAMLAREERDKIAKNTRDGLQAIKETIDREGYYISRAGNRITRLGGSSENMKESTRQKAIVSLKNKARNNQNNRLSYAFATKCRESGNSVLEVLKMLNEAGFRTSRGNKFTSASQIYRLEKMFSN